MERSGTKNPESPRRVYSALMGRGADPRRLLRSAGHDYTTSSRRLLPYSRLSAETVLQIISTTLLRSRHRFRRMRCVSYAPRTPARGENQRANSVRGRSARVRLRFLRSARPASSRSGAEDPRMVNDGHRARLHDVQFLRSGPSRHPRPSESDVRRVRRESAHDVGGRLLKSRRRIGAYDLLLYDLRFVPGRDPRRRALRRRGQVRHKKGGRRRRQSVHRSIRTFRHDQRKCGGERGIGRFDRLPDDEKGRFQTRLQRRAPGDGGDRRAAHTSRHGSFRLHYGRHDRRFIFHHRPVRRPALFALRRLSLLGGPSGGAQARDDSRNYRQGRASTDHKKPSSPDRSDRAAGRPHRVRSIAHVLRSGLHALVDRPLPAARGYATLRSADPDDGDRRGQIVRHRHAPLRSRGHHHRRGRLHGAGTPFSASSPPSPRAIFCWPSSFRPS